MPEIRVHREHKLGLANARKIAWQWAEQVEQKFGMDCVVIEGEHSDTVEFRRAGVDGRLVVAADHFDLIARLGFLLGAFSMTIEREIEAELSRLLAKGSADKAKAATKKSAVKPARKK